MKANLKPNWTPRWLKNKPKGWQSPMPSRDPQETNHQRVSQQREAKRRYFEMVKKAREEAKKKTGVQE